MFNQVSSLLTVVIFFLHYKARFGREILLQKMKHVETIYSVNRSSIKLMLILASIVIPGVRPPRGPRYVRVWTGRPL
jgi:hypothetical protein